MSQQKSIWSNLNKYRVLLASQSPRRVELLRGLDIEFDQKVLSGIDESYPDDLASKDVPLFIVRKKAEAYRHLLDEKTLIIVADTLVMLEDEILGKSQSLEEAKQMLAKLSGKKHQVFTAVGILSRDKEVFFDEKTEVSFTTIPEEAITYYVETYQPLDKAGAYGIQEWIGYHYVSKLEGSYYNVMGLPVSQLAKNLSLF